MVKDYFLGLPEPLTTFALFDYFLDAWVKAEALSAAQSLPQSQDPPPPPGCYPGSQPRPCSRPYTVTNLDATSPTTAASQFYTMSEAGSEDFLQLSHQERVAKIRQTFTVLPPLATSSVKGSSNSTVQSATSSLSPDMSTTAIMRNFLPPNTCFETVFIESSPVTRIVPQAQSEVLHLSRSSSGRSLSHISSGPWPTRSSATQTEVAKSESLKRLPRWKRSSRLRKSVAVMEPSPERLEGEGTDNRGFSSSPLVGGEEVKSLERRRGLYSASDLPTPYPEALVMRHTHSLDNLLDREANRQQFLLKYRQVSGDLRSGPDLVVQAKSARDSSVIMSKAVRKEKRKSRAREASCDSNITPVLQRMRLEGEERAHCYDNAGMEVSPRAPLARHEECDLSPVVPAFMPRQHQYNSSYRLATLHPPTPRLLPRTSTKLSLARPLPPPRGEVPRVPRHEPVYTVAVPGPLRRYSVQRPSELAQVEPFSRGSQRRASLHSLVTVDSGRYSLPPCPTYMELQQQQVRD